MTAVPAGFLPETGTDPAEDYIGPFYLRRSDENFAAGLLIEPRHCNSLGTVHGGVLMTMADFAFCAQARYGTEDTNIITVSLHTEFIAGAEIGSWLESRGEVIRRTGSLVFVQGCLACAFSGLMPFPGVPGFRTCGNVSGTRVARDPSRRG